jgi:hypothetical protein
MRRGGQYADRTKTKQKQNKNKTKTKPRAATGNALQQDPRTCCSSAPGLLLLLVALHSSK